MRNHTKIYLKGMKIDICERFEDMYIPCTWCGGRSVDIHHIDGRQRGKSKGKDVLENLAALCRECHLKAEARQIDKEELRERHLNNIPR